MLMRLRLPELLEQRGLSAYALAKQSKQRISMSTAYRLVKLRGRVQNFDADKTLAALQGRGVKAAIRTRGLSKEIFLTDPDNISVQLTDATYCGGSGPLGNQCNKV